MKKDKELTKYVKRSSKVMDENPQMDEANTKKKVIEPLIDLLGWDLYSNEVKLEYPVQMGSNQKKVDYALISQETPLVFIEAKGVNTQITDRDIQQLKSYMRQDDIAFGMISNGREFRLLKMEWGRKHTTVKILASFAMEDVSEKVNTLKIISKKAIESGESEKIAKNIEETRKALEKLAENKNEVTQEVINVVKEEIGEIRLNSVRDKAAQFVDDLITTLREPVKERVEKEGSKVEKIESEELARFPDGEIIICPSNLDGINFLLQYNAWGFIRINRNPKYLALYVTAPESEIQYFGKVDEIVDPESKSSPVENYNDYKTYEKSKKIVKLDEGSLRKFEKPIPLGEKVPYSPRYSNLRKLATAETTDDVL